MSFEHETSKPTLSEEALRDGEGDLEDGSLPEGSGGVVVIWLDELLEEGGRLG